MAAEHRYVQGSWWVCLDIELIEGHSVTMIVDSGAAADMVNESVSEASSKGYISTQYM